MDVKKTCDTAHHLTVCMSLILMLAPFGAIPFAISWHCMTKHACCCDICLQLAGRHKAFHGSIFLPIPVASHLGEDLRGVKTGTGGNVSTAGELLGVPSVAVEIFMKL